MNAVLQYFNKNKKLSNNILKQENKSRIFLNNSILKDENQIELSTAYYEILKKLW